ICFHPPISLTHHTLRSPFHHRRPPTPVLPFTSLSLAFTLQSTCTVHPLCVCASQIVDFHFSPFTFHFRYVSLPTKTKFSDNSTHLLSHISLQGRPLATTKMPTFHSSSVGGRNEKPDDMLTEENLTKSQKKRRQKRARERARKEASGANSSFACLTFNTRAMSSDESDSITALPSSHPQPATFDERLLLPPSSLTSTSDPSLPLKNVLLTENVRDSTEMLLPSTYQDQDVETTNRTSAAGDDTARPSLGKRFARKASEYFSRVKPVSNIKVSTDSVPNSSLLCSGNVGGSSSSGAGSIHPLSGFPVNPQTGWPRRTTSLRARSSTTSSAPQSIDIIDAITRLNPETGQLEDGGPSTTGGHQNQRKPRVQKSHSSESLGLMEALTQLNPKTGLIDRGPRPRVPLVAPTNTSSAVAVPTNRPQQNPLDLAIAAKVSERVAIDANIDARCQRNAAIDETLNSLASLRADVVRMVTTEEQSADRDAELLKKREQSAALMQQVHGMMSNINEVSEGVEEVATTPTKKSTKKPSKGKMKAEVEHEDSEDSMQMHPGFGPAASTAAAVPGPRQLLPAFPSPVYTHATPTTGSAALPRRHRRNQHSHRTPVVNSALPVRMVPRDLAVVELRRGRVVARDVVGTAMVAEKDE
ncbi:uncharacterized protein K452DRAFT_334389, partial [Aplosporella prunicola CBS 121167]